MYYYSLIFVFEETLKYLFLLFCPDDVIPLDKFVFNTEAHPLSMIDAPYRFNSTNFKSFVAAPESPRAVNTKISKGIKATTEKKDGKVTSPGQKGHQTNHQGNDVSWMEIANKDVDYRSKKGHK